MSSDRRIRWQDASGPPGAPPEGSSPRPGALQPRPRPATPLLDSLGRDLTRLAREGRLAPVYGRQAEMRRLFRILLRKQKNNPLIVGSPGVGKTALVEGAAALVAAGEAPETLRALRIVELPTAVLTAGTQYRGSFEARLQQAVAEAAQDPDLALFVDEIHTLIRAGAVEGGALDAANILKPALARGDIHLIGATTPEEMERFLKADPAFERRFEPLRLEEPSLAEAASILESARAAYQAHHQVQILPEAIEAAVSLSARHILDRSLPDKAFDLLDNACVLARVPEESGSGEQVVDAEMVSAALSQSLGIPAARLKLEEQERLAGLEDFLDRRIYGQPQALSRLAGAVRKAYTGLGAPNRPRQVMAFFGGSGTGKTAAAEALAEFLFGSPEALIRLDLSEYREAHSISRLWGAPPGYLGYADEAAFAGRLRRRPFAVVLLDEFEKAHPDVQAGFLPVFDQGRLQDARGRTVDARQAFFILTSNLFTMGEIGAEADLEAHVEAVRQQIVGLFRPELANRIDEIVLFGELPPPVLAQVAAREIGLLNERLARYGLQVQAGPPVLNWIGEQAYDPNSGARSVLRLIDREITQPLGQAVAEGRAKAGQVFRLSVSAGVLRLDSA